MNIGIFDSGLGGLMVTSALIKHRPEYSYRYLGDTKHVPYGNRSHATIRLYTEEAIRYLATEQQCSLIVIACNTASAQALREIQQDFLPQNFPNLRVLGVIVPTVEAVCQLPVKRVGLLATQVTVNSEAYLHEVAKRRPDLEVIQQAAPLLVPLIEYDGLEWVEPIIRHYLKPLLAQHIEALILGCTHYAALVDVIKPLLPPEVSLICQNDIMPASLSHYLERHQDVAGRLDRNSQHRFLVSDLGEGYSDLASSLYGEKIQLELVNYESL